MQINLWHHKFFHFHLPFWIWKVWKGREKNTKIWVSWEQKELFRWNKKYFLVFEGLSLDEKIVDTSFKIYELSWLLHEDLKTATWYFFNSRMLYGMPFWLMTAKHRGEANWGISPKQCHYQSKWCQLVVIEQNWQKTGL